MCDRCKLITWKFPLPTNELSTKRTAFRLFTTSLCQSRSLKAFPLHTTYCKFCLRGVPSPTKFDQSVSVVDHISPLHTRSCDHYNAKKLS